MHAYILIRKRTSQVSAYSWILAKISESLKRKYSFDKVQFLTGKSRRILNAHLFTELDRVSTPSWKEYLVSCFNRSGDDFSVLVRRAGANGNNSGLGQRAAR